MDHAPAAYTRLLDQIRTAATARASSMVGKQLDGLSRFVHEARRQGFSLEFERSQRHLEDLRAELSKALAAWYTQEVIEELVTKADANALTLRARQDELLPTEEDPTPEEVAAAAEAGLE